VRVVGLVIAGVLVGFGVRSAMKWLRVDVSVRSASERVLFVANITARIGLWFAFAGFFVGWALVDNPDAFGVYVLVPIVLAGIQLVTGVLLSRES
jgi:hypothetical protein